MAGFGLFSTAAGSASSLVYRLVYVPLSYVRELLSDKSRVRLPGGECLFCEKTEILTHVVSGRPVGKDGKFRV